MRRFRVLRACPPAFGQRKHETVPPRFGPETDLAFAARLLLQLAPIGWSDDYATFTLTLSRQEFHRFFDLLETVSSGKPDWSIDWARSRAEVRTMARRLGELAALTLDDGRDGE